MANALITPTVVVNEALRLLDNELVWPKLVHTDYSEEFVQGVGTSVTVKRPLSYSARSTMTMNAQEADEGSVTMPLDLVAGTDIQFTDIERTLTLDDLSDRVLKPAMRVIANKVDRDIASRTGGFYNYVGTVGNTISTWTGFSAAPQRLDEMAVPNDMRYAVLTPNDGYALAGSFNTIYVNDIARPAIESARMPKMAGISEVYTTNNTHSIVTGTRTNGAGLVTNGASQTVTWTASKNTFTSSLICAGFAANATVTAGEVFTIGTVAAGLVAVNPVPGVSGTSKPAMSYLQQFVVTADATADGAGAITLTISPPMVTSASSPYQVCKLTAADTNNLNLVFKGNASTTIPINAAFHKNSIAFVHRPLVMPDGITGASRKTYKGISMRFAPVWDGINSVQKWRFDMIYGVKCIDPRLGVRISGA